MDPMSANWSLIKAFTELERRKEKKKEKLRRQRKLSIHQLRKWRHIG